MKCFWIWLIKLYFKEVSCSQISFYPSSIASFFVALHWRLLLKFTTCQNAQLSLFHSITGKNFRGSINNGKRHLLLCQELASARLQILSPLTQTFVLILVYINFVHQQNCLIHCFTISWYPYTVNTKRE